MYKSDAWRLLFKSANSESSGSERAKLACLQACWVWKPKQLTLQEKGREFNLAYNFVKDRLAGIYARKVAIKILYNMWFDTI